MRSIHAQLEYDLGNPFELRKPYNANALSSNVKSCAPLPEDELSFRHVPKLICCER